MPTQIRNKHQRFYFFFAFYPGLSPFSGIIFYTSFIRSKFFQIISKLRTHPCLKTAENKALLCNQVQYHPRLHDCLNSFSPPINTRWYGRLPLVPRCFYSAADMDHAISTYTGSMPTLIKYPSHTFLFFVKWK